MSKHVLEPEAQVFAEARPRPPFLYELGPECARKVLDDVQGAVSGRDRAGLRDRSAESGRRWLHNRNDRREVVADHSLGYFGANVEDKSLVPSPHGTATSSSPTG